jgi:hypothetical protein
MQSKNKILIGTERGSNFPVVVGSCPHCNIGNRSLILVDFVPNGFRPEYSMVYLKCIGCTSLLQKKVGEVTEDI